MLSIGEKVRITIDYAIAVARFYSKSIPTLLLLDGGITSLDLYSLHHYAKYLSAAEHQFQSIIIYPREIDMSKLEIPNNI